MSTMPPSPVPGALPVAKKTNPVLIIILIVVALMFMAGAAVMVGSYFIYYKVTEAAKHPAGVMIKLLTATNPDIALVSSDENSDTYTFRDKKTNKTVTVNLDQIKRGKIVFEEQGKKPVTMEASGNESGGSLKVKGEDGATFQLNGGTGGAMPAWIPAFPGAVAQGNFSANTVEGDAGHFVFSSTTAPAEVQKYYESQLAAAAMKVSTTTMSQTGQGSVTMVKGDDGKRNVMVTITPDDKGSKGAVVQISYSAKK